MDPLDSGIAASQVDNAELLAVVDQARHLTASRRASLMLPTTNTGELRVAAATGLPPAIATTARVRLGEPVSGVVATTQQPILRKQVDRSGTLHAASYQTGAFISVPVPLQDAGCGVLNVADPLGERTFHEDDLARLQTFGQTIARSLAFASAQRRIQQLEAQVRRLQWQVVQAQEDERRRLARELHDEAGHALTAAIFRLDLERLQLPTDAVSVAAALSGTRETLLECAATLHEVAFALRPRILEDLGLVPAVRSLARQALADGTLQVAVTVDGPERPLDDTVQLVVFRVVQEALTNIRKHTQATQAWIRLAFQPRRLLVRIEDNGRGIGGADVQSRQRSGLGLKGMRERVELLDGVFQVGAREDCGTRLAVQLPLAPREQADD